MIIKSFLKTGLVYRRKSDRIKAHVFVCVLSLLLSRVMKILMGKAIDRISRSLNYLDVVPITVGNRELYVSSESIAALDVLKIPGDSIFQYPGMCTYIISEMLREYFKAGIQYLIIMLVMRNSSLKNQTYSIKYYIFHRFSFFSPHIIRLEYKFNKIIIYVRLSHEIYKIALFRNLINIYMLFKII